MIAPIRTSSSFSITPSQQRPATTEAKPSMELVAKVVAAVCVLLFLAPAIPSLLVGTCLGYAFPKPTKEIVDRVLDVWNRTGWEAAAIAGLVLVNVVSITFAVKILVLGGGAYLGTLAEQNRDSLQRWVTG